MVRQTPHGEVGKYFKVFEAFANQTLGNGKALETYICMAVFYPPSCVVVRCFVCLQTKERFPVEYCGCPDQFEPLLDGTLLSFPVVAPLAGASAKPIPALSRTVPCSTGSMRACCCSCS